MAAQTYVDLARDMEQVEKLGKWITQSKFFACDYEGQGLVIATECYLTGQTPLEYQRRNKMVNGKPFVQYDAMLAGFRERGGYHKVLKNTADEASIEFVTKTGEKHVVSLTWQELSKEPVPYVGKESEVIALLAAGKTPPIKPKYATPRSRATMLFARLVSSSIRVLCPEVNFGVYTEEEVEDMPSETTVRPVIKAESPFIDPNQPIAIRTGFSKRIEPEEIRSRVSKLVEPKETVVESQYFPSKEVIVEPTTTEIVTALLAPEEGPQSASITGPITEVQYARIIELMGQLKAAGEADIIDRVKAKLVASGLEKLRDLNIAEGELLIRAMEVKEISKWFESSLKGHKDPS